MSPRWSLLALGFGVYLAVAVGSFPASLAYRWFGPEPLRLASIEGTIWNGRAAHGAVAGLPFADLRWQLHPAALLTGRISLTAESRIADGFANASVEAAKGRLELRDVRASLRLESVRSVLNLGAVQGDLSVALDRLELSGGLPVVAEGRLTLGNLVAPPLFPTPGVTSIPLGNYRAELTAGDQPGIVATVTDEGGPLELAGRVMLAPDRSFTLDALIRPRPEAPAVLVEGLELVTGEPNATGHRKFVQQGTL